MHLLVSWFVTAAIFYFFSAIGFLIKIESFASAMMLSLFFAIFYVLLRFLAKFLKVTGCLSLGIGYVIGLILQLIAYPLALVHASNHARGVSKVSFLGAVVLTICLIFIRDSLIRGMEEKKMVRRDRWY